MAVGGDRPQHRLAGNGDDVEINAVEIVPRFLGRDGELGALDQLLQRARREREAGREFAGGEVGEIALGEHLQRELGPAGAQRQLGAVAGVERHFRPVGQLSHDIEQDLRRNGGRSGLPDIGRHRLRDLDVEVGCLEEEAGPLGAQEHVREDRDGVPALDDAMDVAEGFEEMGSLDGHAHLTFCPFMSFPAVCP